MTGCLSTLVRVHQSAKIHFCLVNTQALFLPFPYCIATNYIPSLFKLNQLSFNQFVFLPSFSVSLAFLESATFGDILCLFSTTAHPATSEIP